LKDGKTLHADIVSIVKFKDLALLKVNGNGFKSLVLGNIQQAHAGDNVFALGSPGGVFGVLTNTVTRGVVSSVRMMDAPYNANEKIQFVQTDAAINPGNSGGPLINQKGEVLGVNSQKYSKAGIEGLNFAISVEEVKKSFADNIK
jgi:S1-C subfamily serine protease